MANFTDPIKAAFGRYLQSFYGQLVADTPALAEYAARGFAKSAVWAPGRMVDQVEDMLASWRKNDTAGAARATPYLPVMIVAMAKDYVPAPSDYARPLADAVDVMIPGDAKQRVFRMRAVTADIRCQVAICAPEESTARSIAMQLSLFAQSLENRRFNALYRLVGLDEGWPVVLELPDLQAISNPSEVKNLTVLTVDIQMRATVPLLTAPAGAAPNDGKGSGSLDDPSGYLVVKRADGTTAPTPQANASTWTRGSL